MEFQKTVEVGKKDNFWFNLHQIRKQHILTCVFIFLAILALVFVLFFFMMQRDAAQSILGALLTAVIGVVLWNLYILYVKIWSRLNKMYKTKQLYAFRQELTFHKDGIRAVTETGTSESRYKYVLRAEETPMAFYIYMRDDFAYTVPKKQLTERDMNDLRKVLLRHLNKEQAKGLKHA